MDLISLGISIVVIVSLCGTLYYAARMLNSMRHAIMEKSWKLLSIGAISGVIGVSIIVLAGYFTILENTVLEDYVGASLAAFGNFMFFLGLRAHYQVWHPKNFDHPDLKDVDVSN